MSLVTPVNTPLWRYPADSLGEEDIYIAKLDSQGNLLWAATLVELSTTGGTLLPQLHDGSSIITGVFFNEATFGNHTQKPMALKIFSLPR